MKYIGENIGSKILDVGLRNVFCGLDSKGKGNKTKINK